MGEQGPRKCYVGVSLTLRNAFKNLLTSCTELQLAIGHSSHYYTMLHLTLKSATEQQGDSLLL